LMTILLPPVGDDLERIGLPKFPYAARAKLSFAPIGSQDRLTCGPEMHGLLSPPRPTPSKPYRPHESEMEHLQYTRTLPLVPPGNGPKRRRPARRPGAESHPLQTLKAGLSAYSTTIGPLSWGSGKSSGHC
jgi:hypothetical protein